MNKLSDLLRIPLDKIPETPDCPECGRSEEMYVGQDPQTVCSECLEKARLEAEANRRSHELDQRRETADDPETDRLLEIPPRYSRCTAATWSGDVPFSMGEWPDRFDMVYIHGATGSGKTHLATALLRLAWVVHGNALWSDAAEVVETFKKDIEARRPAGHRYAIVTLLLLDDLGSERLTDFSADRLNYVLRHRYNWQLPTIVTSNLRPAELGEQDGRLASRLCSDVTVKLTGDDQRLKR